MDFVLSNLNQAFQNKRFLTIFTFIATLYGGIMVPSLSPFWCNVFSNTIVKIVMLFLILYMTTKNIQAAILLSSLVFIINSNVIASNQIENFII